MPGSHRRHTLATIAVLTAALLFGTTGTVLVNAPDTADAISVGVVRLLIGGLTLLAVSARSVGQHTQAPWRQPLTLLGVAGVACFQLGYFLAVERTGVAVGTVVTIGSGPVLSGMIHSVLTRRAPGHRWLAGTALSVAGVALLGLAGTTAAVDLGGIMLAVLAGLGWAVFATVGKHQIDSGIDSTASMAAMFAGAAIALSPLLFWHSPSWLGEPAGLAVAVYLGVVTVGVAYTLYGVALRTLAAPTVITLTLLEPITAAVLGAVVVHEQVRIGGWVGVVLVLAGLVLTATVAG